MYKHKKIKDFILAIKKSNLKTKPQITKPDLRVAEAPKQPFTKPYNDIDLNNWKNYSHILTDTLWEFPNRDKSNGHSYDYHGNYIPQIAQQLYERFTKKDDIILDMFFGSGTSGIEAVNMGRRCIGVELKQDLVDYVSQKFDKKTLVTDVNIICGDSASSDIGYKIQDRLEVMGRDKAQFLVLHPPYDDIIKFSDKKEDLSNCSSTEEFYELFENVARNGFEKLEKGRFAALIIGDKYAKGEYVPLSFGCMERMNRAGFITKAIIVKDIQGNEKAKGKQANLWRYRALYGGFYIFKHEYVMVFQKP